MKLIQVTKTVNGVVMAKQSFYFFFLGTFLWSAVYAAQPTRQGCDFGDEGHAEFCNILTNCIQAVNLNIFDDAFIGGNLEVVGNVILTDTTPVSCTAPCQTGITGITGAIVVAGGVYVGENLHVCGPINTNTEYDIGCERVLDATGSSLAVGFDALNNLDIQAEDNQNTAVGYQALQLNVDGSENTALGTKALQNNVIGSFNTAIGSDALEFNEGDDNTAIGADALRFNITGISNTAVGSNALVLNESSNNTAIGAATLQSNISGGQNTAVGYQALQDNIASDNTALGYQALAANQSGTFNTALGTQALQNHVSGNVNTAVGFHALQSDISGTDNTAVGSHALELNVIGANNTAIGSDTLSANNGDNNTAIGLVALSNNVTGINNTAVGAFAGVSIVGSNNINISNPGTSLDNGAIRIGSLGLHTTAYLQGVYGVTPAGAPLPVIIDADGQLGTTDALTVTQLFITGATPVSCTAPCQSGIAGITGALIVAGGAYVGENLHVCGPINTNTEYDIECERVLDATGTSLAVGWDALTNLDTSGAKNTAVGNEALRDNTSGYDNTAVGFQALQVNTSGFENTVIGSQALASSLTGSEITAIGFKALFNNTVGDNTAIGHKALFSNQTGQRNTALGSQPLHDNIDGNNNTAVGYQALKGNTDADNTAIGHKALFANIGGIQNTAVGSETLFFNNGNNNTAIGYKCLRGLKTGDGNIAIGAEAGSSLAFLSNNNIIIGSPGAISDNGTIRIGATGIHTEAFIQGVYGVLPTIGTPIHVIIDSDGQLGTVPPSSKRFKKNIETMSEQIHKLLQLRPVEFTFINDASNAKQYGLIAEEVYEVYPEMVTHDAQGNIYSVNYMALIPVLLKQIQQQEERIAHLEEEKN